MKSFLDWVQSIAATLGAPGLFIIGFLDSSFLSFPEVNDLLLVLMVTRQPERMPLYAACATLGSLVGCLTIYSIGRKGGEAFVRRRFSHGAVERTLHVIRDNGVLAILVPSLLPPPAPFKIFVLLAGIAGIGPARFATAIAVGRGIRYFGEGALAVLYGERAIDFIHENSGMVGVVLAVLVLAGAVGVWAWGLRRRSPGNPLY